MLLSKVNLLILLIEQVFELDGPCSSADGLNCFGSTGVARMPVVRLLPVNNKCDDTTSCPGEYTCCKTLKGGWACCPLAQVAKGGRGQMASVSLLYVNLPNLFNLMPALRGITRLWRIPSPYLELGVWCNICATPAALFLFF